MRLLLINPRFPESFWSIRWALTRVLPNKRAITPPLGLATLAALCPTDWHVEIIDENVEPIPMEPRADIVGVCGMGVQFSRQRELLAYYRQRGHFVVAGGSYASLCPEQYTEHADTVVAGEAEYIWPEFCRDFNRGTPKPLYQETGTVALSDSPTPRFDLLKLHLYSYVSMQFSRGCPFRCEFCDIIVMFGRKPRVKNFAQIGHELDALRRLDVHNVFFVDDNLVGNLPMAKRLLAFLRTYQDQHNFQFSFGTEASLNMAQHRDLLELFRDANFGWVFIGIESTDPQSLKETRKTQNLNEDILTAVRRIYSYGIDVLAGFIVGFDHDTVDTFDQQYRFITQSGIMFPMIGLLTALPKTPLYDRLRLDGRLNRADDMHENTGPSTNVIPKGMSYEMLVDGYVALYQRLLTDSVIALRIRNQLRFLQTPHYRGGYDARQSLGIIWRLLWRGILPGGPGRMWHFLRTVPWRAPSQLPTVVADWIGALSMRDFAERHIKPETHDVGTLKRSVDELRKVLHRYTTAGTATLMLQRTGVPTLVVGVTTNVDRAFFRRAAPSLVHVLRDTHARVTLQVAAMREEHIEPFRHLLRCLARYGDRVYIALASGVHRMVSIDASVFHVVVPYADLPGNILPRQGRALAGVPGPAPFPTITGDDGIPAPLSRRQDVHEVRDAVFLEPQTEGLCSTASSGERPRKSAAGGPQEGN